LIHFYKRFRQGEELLQAPLLSAWMSQSQRPQVVQQTYLIQNSSAMSTNAAVVTPVELNKNLLNTLFKFQPLSKLKRFLISKTGVEKTYYSLAEILTILKDVIRGEGMFDEANPSVILCSKDLEEALNMRALHVTEIRDLVLSHITKVPDQSLREKFTQSINICRANTINVTRNEPNNRVAAPVPPRIIRTANISTAVFTDRHAEFTLKPKFLKVVQTVPGIDPKQTIFTYEYVTLLLSKYILSRKDQIFDPRNIKLALVDKDPIGEAFGVKAFHRCQVNNLLRSQLIPLIESSRPDEAIVTSTSSPGVNVLVTEKPVPIVSARGVAGTPDVISSSSNGSGTSFGSSLPAFPALSKAHSTPASLKIDERSQQNERIRKRTSSGEEDVETRAKQARVAGQTSQCNVVIRPANDSDVSTDTETIYSEQGYETIKVADQTQTSDSEDGDTTRNYHDVEYDIESGEEEERPPQAMGMGQDFSSADDTDTDVDEDMKVDERLKIDVEAGAIAHMLESVYWGDSEDDVKMSKTDEKELDSFDSELDNADIWKCISCKTPNKPYIRYCAKCWNIRKGWVPERPKHKRKTRPALASPLKTVINGMDSDTETDGAPAAGDRPRFDSKASISSQDSGIGSQEFEILTQEDETSTKEIQSSSLFVNPLELINGSKFSRSISLDLTSEKSSSGASSMDLGDCGSTSDPKDFPFSPSASDSGCHSSLESSQGTSQLCLMCCQRPKNASLIHGRLGHQVCCYPCAKKLWKKQSRCPVCRRKVERIIKIIQA